MINDLNYNLNYQAKDHISKKIKDDSKIEKENLNNKNYNNNNLKIKNKAANILNEKNLKDIYNNLKTEQSIFFEEKHDLDMIDLINNLYNSKYKSNDLKNLTKRAQKLELSDNSITSLIENSFERSPYFERMISYKEFSEFNSDNNKSFRKTNNKNVNFIEESIQNLL